MLKATAAGMDDWKAHIKFMQYNKEHPDLTQQRIGDSWMKQYRAAPKNIKAFEGDCELRHPTADRRGAWLVRIQTR